MAATEKRQGKKSLTLSLSVLLHNFVYTDSMTTLEIGTLEMRMGLGLCC